jgi:hypothetical protein
MRTLIRSEDGGCGLAGLAMLLCDYSRDPNYRYLTLEGHPPYSLENLKAAAAKEGLELNFYRAAAKEDLFKNQDWPLLALYEKEGESHLVVVDSLRKGYVKGRDPAEGYFRLKVTDFFALWTGVYGLPGDYKKQTCPYKKPKILAPWGPLGLGLVELLAEGALWLGFYFIGQEGNFLWTILLFSLFALLEIGRRRLAVLFMKRFDQRWLLAVYDPDNARFESNYRHYQTERRFFFASPLELVSELILEIALVLLLGLNTPSFLYAVAGVLVFSSALALLLSKTFLVQGKALSREEKGLFRKGAPAESKIPALRALAEKSYRLGSMAEYSHYILVLADLALATIPVLQSQEATLNFYLFHFFALLVLSESFLKVWNLFFQWEEKEPEDRYFAEYLAKKGPPR